MNDKLKEILEECKGELKNNNKGELIRPLRIKLLEIFGGENLRIEKKRRIRLGLLCIDKCLSKEIDLMNLDKRFEKMYYIANNYLETESIGIEWKMEVERFSWDILNCSIKSKVLKLGMELSNTVNLIFYESFTLTNLSKRILDEELDPDTINNYYWASSYYCGSQPWENIDNDIEKRREFWLWFLEEAVPKAYMEFPDKKEE